MVVSKALAEVLRQQGVRCEAHHSDLLNAVGLYSVEQVAAALPAGVVVSELPLPAWAAQEEMTGGGGCSLTSAVVLTSEVVTLVQEYVGRLVAAVATSADRAAEASVRELVRHGG